jgi:hypothetical protein
MLLCLLLGFVAVLVLSASLNSTARGIDGLAGALRRLEARLRKKGQP